MSSGSTLEEVFRRQSDKSLIYIKRSNGPAQGDEIDIEIDGVK